VRPGQRAPWGPPGPRWMRQGRDCARPPRSQSPKTHGLAPPPSG
jgi:hypothetical protein